MVNEIHYHHELTICAKKITIMKISIMYADFVNKIHQKWPTQLGMKKFKRGKCSHAFSKSDGNKTNKINYKFFENPFGKKRCVMETQLSVQCTE